MTQSLIVALLVVSCSVYAAWTLMPAGLRRAIAQRLLNWSLPALLARPLRRAMKPASACGGCDSCAGDAADKPAATASKPITIHRRLPR
jgi:hypothetical protein